ncbi:MAG: hypothetical protein JW741_10815 [Sedimentisphaerales bacterium]|nr:hypothetical protein [Sedimentisphaerales bacterium]
MKTLHWICLLLFAGTLVTVSQVYVAASHGDTTVGKARLPGAGAVIDAAAYPSLQAAFDALPAAGGVVRLPPRAGGASAYCLATTFSETPPATPRDARIRWWK